MGRPPRLFCPSLPPQPVTSLLPVQTLLSRLPLLCFRSGGLLSHKTPAALRLLSCRRNDSAHRNYFRPGMCPHIQNACVLHSGIGILSRNMCHAKQKKNLYMCGALCSAGWPPPKPAKHLQACQQRGTAWCYDAFIFQGVACPTRSKNRKARQGGGRVVSRHACRGIPLRCAARGTPARPTFQPPVPPGLPRCTRLAANAPAPAVRVRRLQHAPLAHLRLDLAQGQALVLLRRGHHQQRRVVLIFVHDPGLADQQQRVEVRAAAGRRWRGAQPDTRVVVGQVGGW